MPSHNLALIARQFNCLLDDELFPLIHFLNILLAECDEHDDNHACSGNEPRHAKPGPKRDVPREAPNNMKRVRLVDIRPYKRSILLFHLSKVWLGAKPKMIFHNVVPDVHKCHDMDGDVVKYILNQLHSLNLL